MLLVPAHSVIDDVTVFADDQLFYVFYLIPGTPSVRLDKNGDPVFMLVEYAISDEDRQAHPELPTGGGYLTFDAALLVTPETMAKIETTLQHEVDAEWQRRKTGTPDEQASQGVAGTTASPTVSFDSPTWTKGTVSFDAPQSSALVNARVAEGTPSLLAGSDAAFNLDLTPAGAAFMQQTLTAAGGAGATDLTPIQVVYDLSFWARLPPVGIIVTADSEKVYQYVRKQLDGQGIDWCTTYDFDHTDIENATLSASGAITVSIEQGAASLPQETVNQLRDYALELVKQMISSSFFTSVPPHPNNGDMPPSGGDGESRKWLVEQYDDTTMNLNVHLEQRSVVEWQVHPQGTLETFLGGVPANELTKYVRRITLDDPFFENLEVTARAFADFSAGIEYVRVDLAYGPSDQKTTSLTFTDSSPQTWKVALIGTERSYRYRTAVAFAGQGEPTPSDWSTTDLPTINVQAGSGAVDVTVLAGDIDWPSVEQVQVTIAYEDLALGIPRQEGTVILTSGNQEGEYTRKVYKPVNQQARWTARFALSSGEVDDLPEQPVPGPQIVVNQDSASVLRVNLLPAGNGWSDIVRVNVDLRLDDPGATPATIDLESIDQFKVWTAHLKDKTKRDYQYRWTASYKSGELRQTDWQTITDGSTTLPITIMRSGLDLLLVPDAIDFHICPVVEVSCQYEAAGPAQQETFVFHDKTSATWHIDVPDGSPAVFQWQITYSPGDRDPITMDTQTEHGTVLILPPYRPSAGGKLTVQILGNLVDYSATPLVGVDLSYDDEPDAVHQKQAIVLDQKSSNFMWEVELKDPSATAFGYAITYYTPDGVPHPQPPRQDTVPRVVIPRYQAT
jgi:hypothetical protein